MHLSVSQTQSLAAGRSLRHENAYFSMKLEEHLLAIAAKFWLISILESFALSHHDGAFP